MNLLFSGIFLVSKKKYGREGAYHDLQSKILCLTLPKTFVREPHSLWEKIWFQNFLWMKRWGITFFRRKVLVSQCRKLSWAFVPGFRKNGVSKKFMLNRGYHNFPSNIFGLTVPKTFVKESYCFWEKNCFENVLWMKRGVSRFSVELFWSHSAEKFRGDPFNVSEILR